MKIEMDQKQIWNTAIALFMQAVPAPKLPMVAAAERRDRVARERLGLHQRMKASHD